MWKRSAAQWQSQRTRLVAHTCNPAMGETQAGDLTSIACPRCEICLTIYMDVVWALFVCFQGLFLCACACECQCPQSPDGSGINRWLLGTLRVLGRIPVLARAFHALRHWTFFLGCVLFSLFSLLKICEVSICPSLAVAVLHLCFNFQRRYFFIYKVTFNGENRKQF